MQAGRMRYMLELFEPVRVTDRFGSETVEWVSRGKVHAERVRQAGRLSQEADERFGDYSVDFNIRYQHAIDEHWRVRLLGEHLYEVTAVIPNIDRGMKTVKCERVNE